MASSYHKEEEKHGYNILIVLEVWLLPRKRKSLHFNKIIFAAEHSLIINWNVHLNVNTYNNNLGGKKISLVIPKNNILR
jgi:hypothetical protein